MKRKLALMLAMLMAFACAQPLTASADEGLEVQEFPCVLMDPSEYEVLEEAEGALANVERKTYDEVALLFDLEAKVKEGLLAGKTEMNLTDMGIEQAKYEISRLINFSPYFCKGINLTFYYDTSGIYTHVVIKNTNTIENTRTLFANADRAVAEILSQVSDSMSVEQKALAIHDYFADQYRYDERYLSLTNDSDSFRSGGLFLDGLGVCEAYANGYRYIMGKLGIECYVTRSEAMAHAWNIIKINGKYYHVDCTWDDPTPDRIGQVGHRFFLVSDNAIEFPTVKGVEKHFGWDRKDLVCSDRTYDNAYWVNITSPIVLQGDKAFYVEYNQSAKKAYLYKRTGGNVETVSEVGQWGSGNSYWPGAYSGLFLYNGRLYYNTSTQVKSVATDGTGDKVEHTPALSGGNNIYGLKKSGGEIQYLLVQDPNTASAGKIEKIPVPGSSQTPTPTPNPDLLFPDLVPGAWYLNSIKYVSSKNIMRGKGDGTYFGPEEKVERSQFITILYRIEGEPVVAYEAIFPDVQDGTYYSKPAVWGYEKKISTGYANKNFGVSDPITREDLVTMMYRYAKDYLGLNPSPSGELSKFPDRNKVSSYAEDPVKWAVGAKIISGKSDTWIDPTGLATRAECAAIIERFMAYSGKN